MTSVLVVDDHADIRELLKIHLGNAGYEVREAADGARALEAMEAEIPSVVILDSMMPVMDGLEVCRRIRAEFRTSTIYVIMLSAKDRTADKISGLDLGADAYLTKPFIPEELIAQVRVGLRTVEDRNAAMQDPLTGLYNRRIFNRMINHELAEWERYHRTLSLVLIDIDHFKKVNDGHGHDAGDRVLVELSEILRSQCRPSDLPCRWGGEEFAWLMPETNVASAQKAAERLRGVIEAHAFSGIDALTISLGVAEAIDGEDSDMLTKRADEALYRAKKEGRNRVVVSNLRAMPTKLSGNGP